MYKYNIKNVPHKKRPKKVQDDFKFLYSKVHPDDKIILQKLLKDIGFSYQEFSRACIGTFISGDPGIMSAIRHWKKLSEISEECLERYSFSCRDRKDIVRELETKQEKLGKNI